VHRFGSSLNLHLHLHVCVFDGVFVERENEALRFSPAQALHKEELCQLPEAVAVRVAKWLRKHGGARDEQDSDSNETRVFTSDEMLARVAAGRGTFEKLKNCPDHAQTSRTETNPQPPPCDGAVTFCGFNLHASVRIAANDDRGRERLLPPFLPSDASLGDARFRNWLTWNQESRRTVMRVRPYPIARGTRMCR